MKTGTRFLGSKEFQLKFTGAAGFEKFLTRTRTEGSPLHNGLFKKLVNAGGFFFMPLVHRCGYWFADLFNDFTGNFLVFYLRWNVSDFRSLGKGKTSQGLFTLFCPAGQTGPYGGSGYGFAGSFRYAPFAQEALK